ncbi:hypothetical protein BDW22DRAFT_1351894 [Trametopsis cervina]|nr:hypothetical protein BDW22DRAFT_1351894 [Trametopsis cervina]
MSTSIGDPFLLSSYSVSQKAGSFAASGPSKLTSIYASHHNGLSPEGYVVATAQGDGLHILDPSTLHPIVSHTLGPSTVFSCPAVSRIAPSSEGSRSSTYAVLENAQGINPNERGRTVRVWIDDASGEGTSSVQQRMFSSVLPHRVSRISLAEELPENVLFLGEHGDLTVTDNEVNVLYTYSPSDANIRPIRSFVFGRRTCSFVPSRSAFKQGAVVVTVANVDESVRLVILAAEASKTTVLAECPVPVEKADVIDASCSRSGFISLLLRSGDWYSLQIETPDFSNVALSKPSPPLFLKGLSFLANAPVVPAEEVAVASIGSSHVLLAGVTGTGSPDLVLLLWDLQYGVLLAHKTVPVPTSLNRNKKRGIDIELVVPSSQTQQALLVLSVKAGLTGINGTSHEDPPSNDATQRSTILILPFSAPPTSTLANALGRATAGEKWLASKSAAKTSSANIDADQTKCLRHMHSAMDQRRVEAVDEAFFSWVSRADSKPSARGAVKLPYAHEFVKQVLEIVLRPPKSPNAEIPYSSKVVRHLLGKRCVSSSMLSGGLLPALRLRKDWDSILLAIKAVVDLPESDLMALLCFTAKTPRQLEKQPATDQSAMDVDITTSPGDLSLASLLPLCVTYRTTASALRLAFRKQFGDAAALTSVLEALAGWLRSYAEEGPQLLPEGTKKDLHGALIPKYEEKQKNCGLPPLEKIITFVQTILDSSFLSLLSYPPSFAILREILSYVEPEVTFTDDLDQLRGPLEPFVKAHNQMLRLAAHGPEKPDLSVDWRKKRKEAHEQATIAVGVYQVEELIL